MKDLQDIEVFVAASVYPAFDHPDLTDDQRAENERIVQISRAACESAIKAERRCIFVARGAQSQLAGFVIVDEADPQLPEIDWLIVGAQYHGTGVAQALMAQALQHIGPERQVKLSVIHYNGRAIRFYEKCGFRDAGWATGNYKISRRLMLRAGVAVNDPPPSGQLRQPDISNPSAS
ncbi:GNAT family N-acetyltransferase [Gloeobacter morelensis]|uniref:GNAT family N-acetyltransferase n=1 Tax=Gloeobacter morelensis TaxID=2907343 RepID=UPI001E476304|nr:GNAT family N-acetyltransferase [Gloeobacter morelensis]